jgi:ABC-type phosphate transport system auxiliary subunit
MGRKGSIMKKYLALLAAMTIVSAQAYDDSFYFDDIDIVGDFSSTADQSEQLKRQRAAMEKRNEQMIQRRIETMRLQQEREMMKRLNQTMNQSFKQLDNALNNM